MEDLFARELNVLSRANSYLDSLPEAAMCSREEYELVVREYAKLLKQLRRIIKLSDRTAEELNATKIDMVHQAYYDTLTGIYNRRYLEERMAEELRLLQVYRGKMSVIMIDVDFFKRYNDTYGHSQGDRCLRQVASALEEGIRKGTDFVARYGGEEFLVVLPGIDERDACYVAERILEHVREKKIMHEHNDAAGCVTISAGVTTSIVTGEQTKEDFINTADAALYESKQLGRNQYTFMRFKRGNKNGI